MSLAFSPSGVLSDPPNVRSSIDPHLRFAFNVHVSPVDESSDRRKLRRALRLAAPRGLALMVYCWKCSDSNPDHYRFCGQCGAPAQRPAAASDKVDSASAKVSAFESARKILEEKIADSVIEVETSATQAKGIRILRTGAGEKRRFVVDDGDGEPKEYATLEEIPEDLRRKIGPALAVADDKRWDSARFDVIESLIDRFRRPYPFDGSPSFSRKAPDWAIPPATPTSARPVPAPSVEKKRAGFKWWFWALALYGLWRLLD